MKGAFLRALVRSASADAPPAGAIARACARLGVEDASVPHARGLVGALLAASIVFMLAWGPHAASSPASISSECIGGIEAPPSCSIDAPRDPSGSSSGTGAWHGSTGG